MIKILHCLFFILLLPRHGVSQSFLQVRPAVYQKQSFIQSVFEQYYNIQGFQRVGLQAQWNSKHQRVFAQTDWLQNKAYSVFQTRVLIGQQIEKKHQIGILLDHYLDRNTFEDFNRAFHVSAGLWSLIELGGHVRWHTQIENIAYWLDSLNLTQPKIQLSMEYRWSDRLDVLFGIHQEISVDPQAYFMCFLKANEYWSFRYGVQGFPMQIRSGLTFHQEVFSCLLDVQYHGILGASISTGFSYAFSKKK